MAHIFKNYNPYKNLFEACFFMKAAMTSGWAVWETEGRDSEE
jgi:hypothetical protein